MVTQRIRSWLRPAVDAAAEEAARKVLADIAVRDPQAFAALVEVENPFMTSRGVRNPGATTVTTKLTLLE